MLEIRKSGKQLTFSGASNVAHFADKQKGPTCGFEAIENIIQLFHNVPNNLVQADLFPRAANFGVLLPTPEGYTLDIRGYQSLLMDYGIPAYWYPFDHLQVLIPALSNNRGVLVIGEGYQLNKQLYRQPGKGHAFVLTNYYTDETERFILGYIGIDSNVEGKESAWPYQNVESSAQWAIPIFGSPVLITEIAINHPKKAKYYKLTKSGSITPLP